MMNMENKWLWYILSLFSIVFDSIFYYTFVLHILYGVHICHKIQKLIFVFYFFNKFCIFENEIKVCWKISKKLYFSNSASLCSDMQNKWNLWVLSLFRLFPIFFGCIWFYLILYFVLYIQIAHFIRFSYLS